MTLASTSTMASRTFAHGNSGEVWIHRCRLEVAPKRDGARVNAARSLMKVVKRLADAADGGDPIKFKSITDKPFSPGNPPDTSTFLEDFGVVNVPGKNQKVVMGFRLASRTPFSTLKARCDYAWMQDNGFYLRTHPMPFDQGMDIILLGYWTMEHPRFFDVVALQNKTNLAFQIAWDEFLETATTQEKEAAKNELGPDKWMMDEDLSIPMGLERAPVKYEFNGENKDTSVIHLTVPRAALPLARFLMDRDLFHTKKLGTFLPFALSKEDPVKFGTLMEKHDDYLFVHRNIQVRNAQIGDLDDFREKMKHQPAIYRVYHDMRNKKVNISVIEKDLRAVISWIDKHLKGTKFSRFAAPKTSTFDTSGSSTQGASSVKTSKYSAAFSIADDDASVGASTIRSAKSAAKKPAWQRQAPITVICDLSEAVFPSLPTVPKDGIAGTQGTIATTPQDQTTVTFDEQTLDKRLDEALAKFQDEQTAKLEVLEASFQKEITTLQKKLDDTIETIVNRTMQALGDPAISPFSTKADHLKVQSTVDQMAMTLNALWKQISGDAGLPDPSQITSPPRKKSNTQDSSGTATATVSHDTMEVDDRPAASREAAGGGA